MLEVMGLLELLVIISKVQMFLNCDAAAKGG